MYWTITLLDGSTERVRADVMEIRDGCLFVKVRQYNGGPTDVSAVYPLTSILKWERA